jgi:hypothetical protein
VVETAGNWIDTASLIFHRTGLPVKDLRSMCAGTYCHLGLNGMCSGILPLCTTSQEVHEEGKRWAEELNTHVHGVGFSRSQWKSPVFLNSPYRARQDGDSTVLLSTALLPCCLPCLSLTSITSEL